MKYQKFSQLLHMVFAIVISFYLGACAQLPEFAHPHLSSEPFDPSVEYVSYRQLRFDDFKAVAPSDTIKEYQHMINAHTSLSLRPATEIKYIITPPHNNFGLYKASLQEVAFKAVMIPTHSWWNPRLASGKKLYVLQHEQIHFALMEITARELNKKLHNSPAEAISGTKREIVEKRLLTAVDKEMTTAQKEILKDHTTFDEETSLHYDPQRQQEWYENSMKRLKKLSQWAR